MDIALIAVLVTSVLAAASALFSKRYYGLKGRVTVLADLLHAASKALEDDQITEEELDRIKDLVNKLLEKG